MVTFGGEKHGAPGPGPLTRRSEALPSLTQTLRMTLETICCVIGGNNT